MPAPRTFISSTCYDLRHIRENLKFFVRSLGFDPVLSEEGAIFYDPRLHAHEACITEVPSCQILVLIIGGRYGNLYQGADSSITNQEYKSAVKAKIPIVALVERNVLDDYRVYKANLQDTSLDPNSIRYPAADSTKIFDFIDEVQSQVVNNALVPFSDFEEMQLYLRQQWAAMLYRFLTTEGEAKRTADILDALGKANDRIEFLTRRIVESVGNQMTKASVDLYDILVKSEITGNCRMWNIPVSPGGILSKKSLDEFCEGMIEVEPSADGMTIIGGGPPYKLSKMHYDADVERYQKLRQELLEALKVKGISVSDYLKSFEP
jgi:hypothetical protein